MNDNTKLGGVFEAIKAGFKMAGGMDFLTVVMKINDFRNTYIAHQEQELKDVSIARKNLGQWIAGLKFISSQP
jgi:type III restriction enzyme